jgi:phosphoribosylformylglycinamidine synthase
VITFPGSNGDFDALNAMRDDVGVEARFVDYRETSLDGLAAVILPGGFSYGDHLRCGAIARFAPVMKPLAEFARDGGPVLGICNGFQILTEAHLLPGALLRNASLRFHCHWSHIRIESDRTAWTTGIPEGTVLRLPVAHGEGAYFADPDTIARMEERGQIVARYSTAGGTVDHASNRNGSVDGIAAVSNEAGNVVGLMPHPERAANALVGGEDGLRLLRSVLRASPVAV